MNDNAPGGVTADLGVTFTEITPGTYYVHFTDYKRDPKINTAQAKYYLEQIQKAAGEHFGQNIHIINDTRLISDRVKSLSSGARKLYAEAYAHPQIGKVAMVGFG
ncbi:MAG: hypothetical protein ACREQV_18025, partial [Candidatus Binatia bacterium]